MILIDNFLIKHSLYRKSGLIFNKYNIIPKTICKYIKFIAFCSISSSLKQRIGPKSLIKYT